MPHRPQVYVLDPDVPFAQNVIKLAENSGLTARLVESPLEFLRTFGAKRPTVLVLEAALPELHGLELWERVRVTDGLRAVFVSKQADVPLAVAAMKLGASDVLVKPCAGSQVILAIQAALQEADALLQEQRETAAAAARMAQLSARQRQIAEALSAGHSTKGVANQLGISEKTVEYHRTRLFRRLGVTNIVQLVLLLSTGQPPGPEGEP